MKRIIAIIAALALSVSLSSCGSNNQANAINAACDLAIAKDSKGTSAAFSEIVANDPGYIEAAKGARLWTLYEDDPTIWVPTLKQTDIENINAFKVLCNIK